MAFDNERSQIAIFLQHRGSVRSLLCHMTLTAAMTIPTASSLTSGDDLAALLRRWRDDRDRAALDQLITLLMAPGWRAARAFARDHAEDVLQDAFLAMTTGAARWQGGEVRSWFVGIVVNTARAHLRRHRRQPAPLPHVVSMGQPSNGSELGERVMAALSRLPEHERVPLWLHVVEGVECQVIAGQLGRPAGTIRAQVARALERLRGILGGAVAITVISSVLHDAAWAETPPIAYAGQIADHAATATDVGTAGSWLSSTYLVGAMVLATAATTGVLLWSHAGIPSASIASPPAIAVQASSPTSHAGEGAPYHLITRAAWTDEPVGTNAVPMDGVRRITIHSTAEHGGLENRSDLEVVRMIEQFHRGPQKRWAAIGYHFLIGRDGTIYEGRPVHYQGAHAGEENAHNLGISMISDSLGTPPSDAQFVALTALLGDVCMRYGIAKADVLGHRDLMPTQCPGEHLSRWLTEYRTQP